MASSARSNFPGAIWRAASHTCGVIFPNVAARPEMFDFPFRISKSRLSDAPKLSDAMDRARGLDGRESRGKQRIGGPNPALDFRTCSALRDCAENGGGIKVEGRHRDVSPVATDLIQKLRGGAGGQPEPPHFPGPSALRRR
jgi:hypothetical protein